MCEIKDIVVLKGNLNPQLGSADNSGVGRDAGGCEVEATVTEVAVGEVRSD